MRHRKLLETIRVSRVGEVDRGQNNLKPSISHYFRHGLYDLQGLLRVCVVDEKHREFLCSIHLIHPSLRSSNPGLRLGTVTSDRAASSASWYQNVGGSLDVQNYCVQLPATCIVVVASTVGDFEHIVTAS
jgi:hypothetical protein